MKKIAIVVALVIVTACRREDAQRPISASCRPSVNIVIPAVKTANARTNAPAVQPRTHEVVQVYWDVSRSMLDFAATKRSGPAEIWTDDLAPVVAALDSGVLLRAHAESVEQFGVGESIAPLPNARAALHPSARRTALHLAAEQIGTALASGTAQAALVVSDMEVDAPPRTSIADATVCRGVPLPSTGEAGSLFGRCFESAVLASHTPARTRTNLLAHVFRKSTHGRELFILLLATDRAFGLRISDEVVRRLDFTRHVIFDSGAVAAANVRGCTLTAASPGMLRTPGCKVKCFDTEGAIRAECDVRRRVSDAWIEPSGRGMDGVTYETLKKKRGDRDEQAVVRFAIPCSTPPGRFNATVSFAWRDRTPWSQDGNGAFPRQSSVRDLFDSLADAIVRIAPARHMRIGIDLVK
ncbi:MAG TPA: hypothetical protein VN181_10695 [Thermoanaerobaculia bacterium]|nr:hypothetical protein [Thermoanaerobaculia bacterium]